MILAKVAAKVFPDMFAKIFSSETLTGRAALMKTGTSCTCLSSQVGNESPIVSQAIHQLARI